MAGVKVPMAVLGAEIDEYSPLELLKQFEEILAAKSEVLFFCSFLKFSHSIMFIFLIYSLKTKQALFLSS